MTPKQKDFNLSQELTEMPGGMLLVRLRLDSLEEAERWVLGFGGHATVIRPEALRVRLAEAAKALGRKYGEAGKS